MTNQTFPIQDFILAVDPESRDFVTAQHQRLTEYGCSVEVKEAKSGYLVSYLRNKKTVLNYVFRKKGLMIRIYANHLGDYMEFLETLPKELIAAIQAAPICKRLVTPGTCNSRCAMGYDFFLCGAHLQKCRNNAFMFPLCGQNNPFIETFLKKELEACSSTV